MNNWTEIFPTQTIRRFQRDDDEVLYIFQSARLGTKHEIQYFVVYEDAYENETIDLMNEQEILKKYKIKLCLHTN